MAELASFSVAANVAQFVELGIEVGNYIYTAYKDREEFKSERGSIKDTTEAVQLIVQELQKRPILPQRPQIRWSRSSAGPNTLLMTC